MPVESEKAPAKPTYDFQRNSTSDDDSGCALEEYAWVPPGLEPEQVRRYYGSLPEDKVPYVNSPGEKYRIEQLLRQLPPHDTEVRYCNGLDDDEKRELKLFSHQRKRENLGRGDVRPFPVTVTGAVCEQCGGRIGGGDVAVFASRAGRASCWHPACFVCGVCGELLADLIYFYQEEVSLAGADNGVLARHRRERARPRIILADECTEAEGRHWHTKHFCCSECGGALGGRRYIMKEGDPYCCRCFQSLYAEDCHSCGERIGIDQGQMTYDGRHWHASEGCFCCARCKRPLLGRPFLPERGRIFCSRSCGAGEEPDGSDSSDRAFQSARSATESGRGSEAPKSGGGGRTETSWGRVDPLSFQMDLLSLSSQTPALTREPAAWQDNDRDRDREREQIVDGSKFESRAETSARPSPPQLLSQRDVRTSSNSPSTGQKQQQQDRRRQNGGFSARERSVGLRGFRRDGEAAPPPDARTPTSPNPIGALHLAERPTPLERTPGGSAESLALSDTAGDSAPGDGTRPAQLSRFSMPDLSKNSGPGVSEKRSLNAPNSSVRFRSSDSLRHVNGGQPHVGIDPSGSSRRHVNSGEPSGVETGKSSAHFPPGFARRDDDDGRNLASGANAARLPPIRERGLSGVPEEAPPRRRRHRRRSGRSRRSRSENALNSVAECRPRPEERLRLRVREDDDRFPARRSAKERFGVTGGGGEGGGFRPQLFGQCPRTASDLTLQNPAAGQRAGLNQYSWDDDDGDDSCSTCSSSSESEDEGYFLGEPIPRPLRIRHLSNQELVRKCGAGIGAADRGAQLTTRKRPKSNNCVLS
uniref:Prickle homolog 2b n=1 Tax=Hippocampus comes TaxID=109280 RepID=A0A3Q3DDP9_HIPCM